MIVGWATWLPTLQDFDFPLIVIGMDNRFAEMARRYNYAREKLRCAVYILATSEGDVRSRLRKTYRHIRFLDASHVPDALIKDLQWVKSAMVKFGPMTEGQFSEKTTAIENTMRRIRNSTGKKIAERIFSLDANLLNH